MIRPAPDSAIMAIAAMPISGSIGLLPLDPVPVLGSTEIGPVEAEALAG